MHHPKTNARTPISSSLFIHVHLYPIICLPSQTVKSDSELFYLPPCTTRTLITRRARRKYNVALTSTLYNRHLLAGKQSSNPRQEQKLFLWKREFRGLYTFGRFSVIFISRHLLLHPVCLPAHHSTSSLLKREKKT